MTSNKDPKDFAFTSHGTTLVGTLLLPAGPEPGPAALVLAGSGPVDRDSNLKRMRLEVTRAVAEALHSGGVGSLRYDKRGVGASGGDYHSAGLETMIDDARSALQALKHVAEVDPDRIVVVGHSEGALIAARLAATEAIAGAALLSGTVMSGEQILTMQAEVAAGSLPKIAGAIVKILRIDIAKSQAKRIERLRRTTDDVVRMQGVRVNARWFREFLDHDPTVDLAEISVPLLAITGGKDIQVQAGDVDRMGEIVSGPFEGHVLPGLSHIFRADPDDRGLQGYRPALRSGEPVDGNMLDLVVDWTRRILSVPA